MSQLRLRSGFLRHDSPQATRRAWRNRLRATGFAGHARPAQPGGNRPGYGNAVYLVPRLAR